MLCKLLFCWCNYWGGNKISLGHRRAVSFLYYQQMHIRDSIESDFVLNDANNGNIRHLFFVPSRFSSFLFMYAFTSLHSRLECYFIKQLLVIFERNTQQFCIQFLTLMSWIPLDNCLGLEKYLPRSICWWCPVDFQMCRYKQHKSVPKHPRAKLWICTFDINLAIKYFLYSFNLL